MARYRSPRGPGMDDAPTQAQERNTLQTFSRLLEATPNPCHCQLQGPRSSPDAQFTARL